MRSSAPRLAMRCGFPPSTWTSTPAGWYLFPHTDTPASEELGVCKAFDFLNHGAQYVFLGRVMALAAELQCIPRVEWFFSELRFLLPPSRAAEVLANYMNDQERQRCGLRNHTLGGTSTSPFTWSPGLVERVETRADEEFCWALTRDQRKTQRFLQETYVQWHHRAEYLVARKSREKREFRQDLTLFGVMQQGQERKRRMQRRRNRTEEREEKIRSGEESPWDTFTHDVLPRELREALDRESDGMEDVRLVRSGSATGGWSRSHRSNRW